MISQIIQVCLIPLLGILAKYLVDYLSTKRDELKQKTDTDMAKKYIDMTYSTIRNCVLATNQTFVESLKSSGKFDEEAQKEAFNRTMNAVLAVLTQDAKDYITAVTGDLNTYLTQLIEATVHDSKIIPSISNPYMTRYNV